MTAANSKATAKKQVIDTDVTEEVVTRVRELNENILDSLKQAGHASLDAYETGLQSLVDFQQQVASGSQIEWVSTLANMQAKFVQDLSSYYLNAARDMLK